MQWRTSWTISKFLACVLDVTHDEDNGKKIESYEIEVQINEEGKVDYNPINKYIKAARMQEDYSYSPESLAEIWQESTATIKKWLSVKKKMDKYLERIKQPGKCKLVRKMEDGFLNYNKMHNLIANGTAVLA